MTHHKLGRIQLNNIHDRGNLVALCSTCHFAFDNDEWTFIPKDVTSWKQKVQTTPHIIQEYNLQRNVAFRRLLLTPDPDSKAFQDNYYKSAFINSPIKIWPGEPGVIIVRPPPAPPPEPSPELQAILDDFGALQKLWLAYKSPCSDEKCPICQGKNDENQGMEDDDDEKDEGKDEDEDENEDENVDGDSGEDDEDDVVNEDYGEEGEEGDEDINSSRKRRNISKGQPERTRQQAPLQNFDTKTSIQANKHGKKPKSTERDWMTSAPYDESVPYSHRYGYTWSGTTSNDLMQLWQLYRKPADD